MSSIDEQLRANLSAFQDALQQVETMTEDVPGMGLAVPVDDTVKTNLRRQLYDKAREEYERLAALKVQEVQSNMDQARQKLFRTTPTITESHSEVTMSTRDAQDRLRGVTNPQELSARLRDAVELGDRVMSRQILRTAVDQLGDIGPAGANLVKEYLSYYPNEQESYYALEDAHTEQVRLEQMGVSFSPSNPEDVSASFGRGAGPGPTDTPLTHHPTTGDTGKSGTGGLIPDGIVSTVQPETSSGGE